MISLLFSLLIATGSTARAEDAPQGESEELVALRERLRQLEAEMDRLRAAQAEPEVTNEELPVDLETQVHGYAAISTGLGTEQALGVALDDLIFVYSANLDRKYAFYSEVAMEPEEEATSLDIETLELRMRFDPRFGLIAGRIHAPNGWWTSTALHGAYRYLPTEVPHVMVLEDHGGGYIPMHQAGLFAQGALPIGLWQVQYYAGFSNGRSPLIGGIAQTGDHTWNKAAVGRVSLASPGGLLIGVGAHRDRIEPMPEDADHAHALPSITQDIEENILSGHFVVQGNRLQVASELFVISHATAGGEAVFSPAGYALVGVETGAITPYALFDMVAAQAEDPLFSVADNDGDIVQLSAGLRYDLGLRIAIKVQGDYVHTSKEQTEGGGTTVTDAPALTVQLSGGF